MKKRRRRRIDEEMGERSGQKRNKWRIEGEHKIRKIRKKTWAEDARAEKLREKQEEK
jgi:hypothetical protein